jgi:hypothetical protein
VQGYWTALDVIAIHYKTMETILEAEQHMSPVVRFGGENFLEDLEKASCFCGLQWNKEHALQVYDLSCVHQEPASVVHEAQEIYERLGGTKLEHASAECNTRLIARDSRQCEAMLRRHTARVIDELIEAQRRSEARQREVLAEVQQQVAAAEHVLSSARRELADSKAEKAAAETALSTALDELAKVQTERSLVESALSAALEVSARLQEERALAAERYQQLRDECLRLREQSARFESHPLLGHALRARRRLKHLLRKTVVSTDAQ